MFAVMKSLSVPEKATEEALMETRTMQVSVESGGQ